MVVPGDMKVKTDEDQESSAGRTGGASSAHHTSQQHNHLPILKGILDGVVEYHNAPVRFGRVPKREKARILAAMHQSCQSRSAERAAVAEQLNGVSGGNQINSGGAAPGVAAENGSSAVNATSARGETQQSVQHGTGGQVDEVKEDSCNQEVPWRESGVSESAEDGNEDELEASRLANTVLRAHSDTCHFAHLRPKEGASGCPRANSQASSGPVYSVPGRNGPILACPLNPRRPLVAGLTPDPSGRGEDTLLQDFSQRFSPAIRGVVEFAKRIPGFALLSQSDQVTLLKAGVFEVLLLRLACLFDAQTNTMTCLNGELLRRESIVSHSPSSSPSNSPTHASNARFLVDSMFEFAARLNSLQLSDAELALFSAVVIIAPDRPGLRHTDLISRIQSRLIASLSLMLSHSHPSTSTPPLLSTLQSYIPDLRTLNTLHSEKLLAFKMTEQQQQSNNGQTECMAEGAMHNHHGRQVCPRTGAVAQDDQCKQYATVSQQGRHTSVERATSPTCRQQMGQRPMGHHGAGQQVVNHCLRQMHQHIPEDSMNHQQTEIHHQPMSWKDDEVQEVEELEETEEEEKWRSNTHGRTMSAVVSGLKSPLSSVSSSESICSGEVASLSEFRNTVSASAPLLAASLSGATINNAAATQMQGFPKRRRHRDRSGSNSEEDTSCGSIQVNPCTTQVTQIPGHRNYFRKLDSPSDSGIESGTERLEKSSTSTSVCSSPRSSLEDKDEGVMQQHKVPTQLQQPRRCPHMERPSAVEDMPVLKRVLQAPPLYDTNSLMDEAYKPHKKFRALRKDCAEAEAIANSPTNVPSSPGVVSELPRMCAGTSIEGLRHIRLEPINQRPEKPSYASLETARQGNMRAEVSPVRMDHNQGRSDHMSSPPLVVLSPPTNPAQSTSPHSIISTLNIHLPQITIHAQPMRIVSPGDQSNTSHRLSPQPQRNMSSPINQSAQLSRLSPQQSCSNNAGDRNGQQQSNPPLLLQKALLQPPANQHSLQSHQHQALLSALSGDSTPRVATSPQPIAQSSPLTASLLSAPTLNSNLSSTHSTLARSLMEGPKMTAEQMKRTDIIHSYIMREGNDEQPNAQGYSRMGKQCPQTQSYRPKASPETVTQQHDMLEDNYRPAKVTQQGYRQNTTSNKEQTSQAPGVLVFNGSYLHMGWNGNNSVKGQCATQGNSGDVQSMGYSSPPPAKQVSEVKQGGQPLNLSKKTPPPSPATTPVVSASVLEA